MRRRRTVPTGAVRGLVGLGMAFILRGTNGSSSATFNFLSSANTPAFPKCNGTASYIGDGHCDAETNDVVRIFVNSVREY